MVKVFEVFTKRYREDVEYRELLEATIDQFKLNNQSESVEDKIKRLKAAGYVSNFKMKVGSY